MRHKNNQGQALLIILLAMATITTVVLSIVSRSVSEVEITNKEEDALRAFTVAEAGVEQALVASNLGTTLTEDITVPVGTSGTAVISNYSADVTGYPQNSTEYAYPFELASGDAGGVWMVTRNGVTEQPCTTTTPCYSGNSLQVCWGLEGTAADAQSPALEVTFTYLESNTYNIARVVADPYTVRRSSNKFETTTGSCDVAGESYAFSKTINLAGLSIPSTAGALKLMKVRMLYNTIPQPFGVKALSGTLVPQGKLVSSTGQAGNSTRKIEAYLINPVAPSIFDAAIYSGVTITK